MTLRGLAVVGVRLFSLYLFFAALNMIPSAVTYASFMGGGDSQTAVQFESAEKAQALGFAVQWLICLGFALFLWLSADKVARHMTNESEADALEKIAPGQLQGVAFSTIGLYSAFQSLQRLISYLISLRTMKDFPDMAHGARVNTEAAASVVMLLISLWLLFGSAGIVKAIYALRDLGRERIPVKESPDA